MIKAYKIKNWEERFEMATDPKALDDRLIEASKLLSKGKEGAAALAVWLLLVKFASKMPQRGLLVSAQKALTPKCLAEETGFSEKLIQVGIDTLMSSDMEWVELVDCPKYLVLGDHAKCAHIGSAPEVEPVSQVSDEAPLVSFSMVPPSLEKPAANKQKHTIEWKKASPKYKQSLGRDGAKNRWRGFLPGSFRLSEEDFSGEEPQQGLN